MRRRRHLQGVCARQSRTAGSPRARITPGSQRRTPSLPGARAPGRTSAKRSKRRRSKRRWIIRSMSLNMCQSMSLSIGPEKTIAGGSWIAKPATQILPRGSTRGRASLTGLCTQHGRPGGATGATGIITGARSACGLKGGSERMAKIWTPAKWSAESSAIFGMNRPRSRSPRSSQKKKGGERPFLQ